MRRMLYEPSPSPTRLPARFSRLFPFSRVFLGSLFFSALLAGCQEPRETRLDLRWEGIPDRPWPGPDLWANRIQDWAVKDGKLTASGSLPMRTAHILTRRATPDRGTIRVTLEMGIGTQESRAGEAPLPPAEASAGGILLGAGGESLDFRRAALIHHSPGPGGGLFLGVDEQGFLVVRDFRR